MKRPRNIKTKNLEAALFSTPDGDRWVRIRIPPMYDEIDCCEPKAMRRLGCWLIEAAEWIEAQR